MRNNMQTFAAFRLNHLVGNNDPKLRIPQKYRLQHVKLLPGEKHRPKIA